MNWSLGTRIVLSPLRRDGSGSSRRKQKVGGVKVGGGDARQRDRRDTVPAVGDPDKPVAGLARPVEARIILARCVVQPCHPKAAHVQPVRVEVRATLALSRGAYSQALDLFKLALKRYGDLEKPDPERLPSLKAKLGQAYTFTEQSEEAIARAILALPGFDR